MIGEPCPVWVSILFTAYLYGLIWMGSLIWITRYPATLPRAYALPRARVVRR